jgi:hypothetical protein
MGTQMAPVSAAQVHIVESCTVYSYITVQTEHFFSTELVTGAVP